MRRGRIGPVSYKDQIGVQSHSQSLTAASVELKGVTGGDRSKLLMLRKN